MLTACPLIDLLTQYYYGLPASDSNKYKEFLRMFMPAFKSKIKPELIHWQWNPGDNHWIEKPINNYAEAFYYIFRCGLLHNAMIGDNGRISGKSILKKTIKLRKWSFKNKKGIEVAVNAELLLNNIERFFKGYIKDLRDKQKNELRECFRRKFQWDFGIEVNVP